MMDFISNVVGLGMLIVGLLVFALLLVGAIKILQGIGGWINTRKAQRLPSPKEGEYIVEVDDPAVYEKMRVTPMLITREKK